jgi:hypothetical protein
MPLIKPQTRTPCEDSHVGQPNLPVGRLPARSPVVPIQMNDNSIHNAPRPLPHTPTDLFNSPRQTARAQATGMVPRRTVDRVLLTPGSGQDPTGQLGLPGDHDQCPLAAWSPDGRMIAYVALRQPGPPLRNPFRLLLCWRCHGALLRVDFSSSGLPSSPLLNAQRPWSWEDLSQTVARSAGTAPTPRIWRRARPVPASGRGPAALDEPRR